MKKVLCVLVLLGLGISWGMMSRMGAREPKTSNAPFLKPAEAVAKMSIPDGF